MVTAQCAEGRIADAMTWAVEIMNHVHGVTGRDVSLVRPLYGAFGSLVWITLSLLFNVFVYVRFGSDRALEFFQAWLIEKALSVDNLFVFLAAFSYFSVPARLQPGKPRTTALACRKAVAEHERHRRSRQDIVITEQAEIVRPHPAVELNGQLWLL